MSHNIRSRKSWHQDYADGQESLLRLPYIRPTDERFVDSFARQMYEHNYSDFSPLKQNQRFTFDPQWGSLTFLDAFLKCNYGEITFTGTTEEHIQDAAEQLKIVAGGMPELGIGFVPKVFDPNTGGLMWKGEQHYVLYGDWIAEDRQGKAILVPASVICPNGRDFKTLEDLLDIKLHILTPEDRLKIRKYFKRLKAPHVWGVTGEFGGVEEVTVREGVVIGEKVDVVFNGVGGSILYIDIDQFDEDAYAACDGQNFIDVKWARLLGEAADIDELRYARVGDCFKFTSMVGRWFGKGLCHVVDMKGGPYQVITYGPKKQLEFKHAFIGSMGDIGDVDDSEAFTEVQSIICFTTQLTYPLWIEIGRSYLRLVQSGLYDENLLRYLFLVHIAPLADMLKDTDPDAEIWSLIEAIKHGVPILGHPALVEKIARYFMTEVTQFARGRMPYGNRAYQAYFQPDMVMFDFHTGDVDVNQSSIGENEVCCMDAPAGQTLVIYRRPIGNNQEAIFAVNVGGESMRRWRVYKGRGRVILGRGIRKQYKTAGGGDGDDQTVVITDKALIEAIMKAPKYPLTPLPTHTKEALTEYDGEDLSQYDEYYDEDFPEISQVPTDVKEWVIEHCWEACDTALARTVTIGMVSNVNTLDQQLSGEHKLHMLRKMAAKIQKLPDGPRKDFAIKCHLWLLNRKEYVERAIGSNMEKFIDNIKLGKGGSDKLVLDELWADAVINRLTSLVYPIGVFEGGRVPAKRVKAGDFMTPPSLLDEIKNTIKNDIAKMFAHFQERKWDRAIGVPSRLNRVFPRHSEISALAEELYGTWNSAWNDQGKVNVAKTCISHNMRWIILNGGPVYMNNGSVIHFKGVRTMFIEMTQGDIVKQRAIAVEIARLSYTGREFQVDGLLWQDFMAKAYIGALKMAGLTGWYVPVQIDRRHGDIRTLSKRLLLEESLERTKLIREGKNPGELKVPAGASIQVRVVEGVVTRISDDSVLGTAMGRIENGEYTMIDTLIEVKKAHPELTGR